MGALWQVHGFVPSPPKSVIDEWIETASDDALAKFDSRLLMLTQLQSANWKYEHAHHLSGVCNGLFEIRFQANNVAHRPLCCFGPNRMTFTVLFFATEHNGNLRPKGACTTALARHGNMGRPSRGTKVYDGYQPELSR